jgi:hypothetical protein
MKALLLTFILIFSSARAFDKIAIGNVTASSTDSQMTEAKKVVDGKKASAFARWVSDDNSPEHWIALNLAAGLQEINQIQIATGTIEAFEKQVKGSMKHMKIQFLNDQYEWVTLYEIKDNQDAEIRITLSQGVQAHSVRIVTTDKQASIFEVEVYGKSNQAVSMSDF